MRNTVNAIPPVNRMPMGPTCAGTGCYGSP